MIYKIVPVYKSLGYTSLQALNVWRQNHPQWNNLKMTYTGRLDPMAEGVMLVAIDEALQDQVKYQSLDKVYQARVLFGFTSDSYDVLGFPKKSGPLPDLNQVKQVVQSLVGDFKFSLPPFSSYKVKGKKLFWWALHNRLAEITIPQKTVSLKSVEWLGNCYYQADEITSLLVDKFSQLKTDLRQDKILPAWRQILTDDVTKFLAIDLSISCSSGTYIRSLANELGNRLGCGAVLLSLLRTKVGEYTLADCQRID
ncbi:MAG: hypothetical protein ACOZAJ_00185 [Patescibacteria group bacterium]